ncbi:hypothetical protein [Candidatus Magnetobacterium casense]|uniref:Secreted protein n=1 Tax=Candidatus Magnetobacterium casense TaxID=1455061 RepID=A0ABS6S038_9BACT|nr:hypothetical protein [Candidatus Magnetobacterium casensis]MBV6341753.1 hypothetical protein [Candidatus Magnetobacterium casensis]
MPFHHTFLAYRPIFIRIIVLPVEVEHLSANVAGEGYGDCGVWYAWF